MRCAGKSGTWRLVSADEVTSQEEEVGGDHGGAHVAVEGASTLPGAATKTEDTLEEGNHAFNSGAEVSELAVHPGTGGHLVDSEAALLGEDDVVHAALPGIFEIVLAREGTVGGDLARIVTVMLAVTIEHADEERDVGGIAGFHDPVENEPALPPVRVTL